MSNTDKTEFILTARDDTKAAFEQVRKSLGTLQGVAIGLGPIFSGLTALLSFSAFKEGIENTIKFAAALDDMAERTGASVENLSALAGVAKIGGHELASVEAGMQKLAKALHLTDDETKGAGKALAALGLSIEDLRSKDTAEAMLEVARALDQFRDGSGKTAAAIAILGKNGAQLLPFLKDLAEQSELIGKVTAEQAAQAEQYEKNIKKLEASFSRLARSAALEVTPALASMTGQMAAAIQASGGWSGYLQNLGGLSFKGVAADLDKVSRKVAEIEDRISIGRGKRGDDEELARLQSRFKMLKAIDDQRKATMANALGINDIEKKPTLDGFTSGKEPNEKKKKGHTEADDAARLIASLNEQIALKQVDLDTTDKMTASEQQAVKVRYQLEAGTLKATAAQREAINAALDSLVALDKQIIAADKLAEAEKKSAEALAKGRQNWLDQIAAANQAADTMGMTAAAVSALEQARLSEAITLAEENGASAEAIALLKEELDYRAQLTDALARGENRRFELGKNQFDEFGEFAKQAARNAQDAFADFLFDPFDKGTKGMVQSFEETIRRMIAQAAAAQLGKLLFGNIDKDGKLGGVVGSAASSFDWGKAAGWIASLFSFEKGGIMTSAGPLPLRAYAGGGVANSPQLALFGEGRTPEAFVPLPDGRNIPVKMHGASGNINVTQHIVVNGSGDPAEIRRSAASGARGVLGVISSSRRYS
ncbi:MAG: phage tail tape measure protein [Betaproteobacteria bacterium]|nr:phage tail tape measure protein [Betaproteobacteria bacterium]